MTRIKILTTGQTGASRAASATSVTPAGNIAATNVQAALEELDAEKQPLDSDLTAIAALSTQSFGRSLLTQASASAARTTLGVDYTTIAADTALTSRFALLGQQRGNTYAVAGESESEVHSAWHFLLSMRSNGEYVQMQRINGTYAQIDSTSTSIAGIIGQLLSPVPSVLFVMTGRNDAWAGTVTFDQFKTNIRTICTAAKNVGSRPVVCTLPPLSASQNLSSSFDVAIALKNRWLKNFAAYNGYALIDFYAILVDPATGRLKTSYADNNQNIKLAGHVAMTDEAIRVLRQGSPYIAHRAMYEGDPGSLISNGMAMTDSNADGLPDGYTTFSLSPTTLAVATDSRFMSGKALQITQSASTNSPQILIPVSSPTTKVSAGDICVCTFSWSIESVSGTSGKTEEAGFSAYLQMPATENFFSYQQATCKSSDPADLHRWTGLAYFPTTGASWNRSSINVMFRLLGMTAGMSIVVRVGDVALYNMTREASLENGWCAGTPLWANVIGGTIPFGT